MQADQLVAAIRKAIDEDERLARATVPGPWRVSVSGSAVISDTADLTVMENFDGPGPWDQALPAHIARHDPARVLRQVEAHRKIIEMVMAWAHCNREDTWYSCGLASEGCANDDNVGRCTCDLDERRFRMLTPLADIYGVRDSTGEEVDHD